MQCTAHIAIARLPALTLQALVLVVVAGCGGGGGGGSPAMEAATSAETGSGTPGVAISASDQGTAQHLISGSGPTVEEGTAPEESAAGPEPAEAQEPGEVPAVRKYHPGHFIAMNRADDGNDMAVAAMQPGVSGVQRRYFWKELEPSMDNYDFTTLEAELDLMASQGRQMVVLIEDKTFTDEMPAPPYLRNNHQIANRAGGYTMLRWKPYVVTRLTRLIEQIATRFDTHPAFEGLALQESSLSLDDSDLDAHGYTPELYRDALITVLTSAAGNMPHSTVFWYMNFLPRNQSYLRDIALVVAPLGVAAGGPDVLPDDPSLPGMTYPLYDELQGSMPLFNSIQFDSYSHPHTEPGYATVNWTLPELFAFARDELHVNYLFWSRKIESDPPGSYTYTDALAVIAAAPTFNP